ncbi:Protein CBG27406 [Caenorhabditis briggsae]|uniref:Uncharacterized protein n=2 Tax=Caenorhabditis briggsae TaxID=6238 RepID=A0AAE8ZNC5_CAEBR|nr:Protein CBG27406 [Caenorhabditis briggsae]ULT79766.1 hypothetical protein L3Y34_010380 [Caenorhabditis briggsae]UMM39073.1 hypothetical protein L5515_016277 [Caenorhabditis briggsae]CAS00213.1 Protein CBG27406 [Caenorhabditis briggsae]
MPRDKTKIIVKSENSSPKAYPKPIRQMYQMKYKKLAWLLSICAVVFVLINILQGYVIKDDNENDETIRMLEEAINDEVQLDDYYG